MHRADLHPEQYQQLVDRVGRVHLRQRLGIESTYEAKVFGQGRTWFHFENIEFADNIIEAVLKAAMLYRRGQRNARLVRLTHNVFNLARLPRAFDGYRLLHISDLHLDLAPGITEALLDAVRRVRFDACVLTGDFRAATYGDFQPCLEALAQVRAELGERVFAVLGNHDSIRMVPGIEALDIEVLINECALIEADDEALFIAGIDDAHYFRADNIEKAADTIPDDAASILLSHTPEIYKNAAHAGFDILLAGHTHGGQICLPGGWPVMLNADCRRRYCRGRWDYQELQGYTTSGSGACVVDVRFNCPPEIVLHTLRCAK